MVPRLERWLQDNPRGESVSGSLSLSLFPSYTNVRTSHFPPLVIQPVERYNEVLASLATSTSDLSISRPAHRLSWGIPVPNDPSHTIYVWMDALTNYLTVTGYPHEDPNSADYQGHWPVHTHLVGKDIIR